MKSEKHVLSYLKEIKSGYKINYPIHLKAYRVIMGKRGLAFHSAASCNASLLAVFKLLNFGSFVM